MDESAEVTDQPIPPTPASDARQHSVEGSVKDTIESILVAFILAFIFRAFVVEAFVIPTGSMAPTLLGAHMRFRCPDCGYRFDVNYQGTDRGGDDIDIPRKAVGRSYTVFCPNCGFRLPQKSVDDPQNAASDPDVHYGDRILVLKYLYLLEQPKRWDVVVFKAPVEPARHDYSQNYIKRLAGNPGETIMILDGDVYVAATSSEPTPEAFTVQTKPHHVQEALWRIVYDNDYHPRGLPRADVRGDPEQAFQQPWKLSTGQKNWTVGNGLPGNRDFTFDDPAGSGTLSFDPEANPYNFALTDWLAYDVTEARGSNDYYRPENNVSDVKLSFFYTRKRGDGSMRVELTKIDHTFEASIAPDKVTLLMDGKPVAAPVAISRQGSAPIHVEMMNVDYRVSIRIDGKEVIATTPEQYHPNVRMLLDSFGKTQPKAQVRITGEEQVATLSHVNLWRDVYYLSNRNERGPMRKPLWASAADFPKNLAALGPDEFFVLGDNSLVSLDARFWDDPINLPHEQLAVMPGRVPRRFMLGKAFFVYWPAGYRPVDMAPALAPNFGDMRFIH